MPIWTAAGPIAPEHLGPTSMHEHILCDGRVYLEDGPRALGEAPLTLASRGRLERHWLGSSVNLGLEDVELAVEELARAARQGLRGVVELTVEGIDHQRADAVGRLLEAGYVDQLVLGCDVWAKGGAARVRRPGLRAPDARRARAAARACQCVRTGPRDDARA